MQGYGNAFGSSFEGSQQRFHVLVWVEACNSGLAGRLVSLLRDAARRFGLVFAVLGRHRFDLGDDVAWLESGTSDANAGPLPSGQGRRAETAAEWDVYQLARAACTTKCLVNLGDEEGTTRALVSAAIRANCSSFVDAGRCIHVLKEFDWHGRLCNTRLLHCDEWAPQLAIFQASTLLGCPVTSVTVGWADNEVVDLAPLRARFPGVDVRARVQWRRWLSMWWCCRRWRVPLDDVHRVIACLNNDEAWCQVQGPTRKDPQPHRDLAAIVFAACMTTVYDDGVEPGAGCMSVTQLGAPFIVRLRLLGFQIVSGHGAPPECVG
jgi:hypothetical protein